MKKIKKRKSNRIRQHKPHTINKEDLISIYQSEITEKYYDETVLIILGGEYGTITDYVHQKYSPYRIIVIEPNPNFYTNSVATENHKKLINLHGNIDYLSVPEIEKNSQLLLQCLVNAEIINKGLEIIINPYYKKAFPEVIKIEEEKLLNYLRNFKSVEKGISPEKLEINQAKFDLTEQKLNDILQTDSINLDKLFEITTPDTGDGSLVVLVGGEFNFYAAYLMKKHNIHNLVVVEPSEKFSSNKTVRELSEKTNFDGVKSFKSLFLDKDDSMIEFFEYIKGKLTYINNIKIVINPIYEKYLNSNLSEPIKEITTQLKNVVLIKGNSLPDDLYGMGNSLYNLKNIENMKRFEGLPQLDTILSVAAGPSLDDHMDELKILAKKYPVMAVEVIANRLVEEGIIPDIVCSQERVYEVYKIINRFVPEVRENSVFMAPTLIHPFIPDILKNYVIFVQPTKSPLEGYLAKKYYDFTHIYPQSMYAGEVNILSAMLFNPKKIILFGHDLAITEEKFYAQGSEGNPSPYKLTEEAKEIGNRGQTVYLNKLFKMFKHNTEVLINNLKKEHTVDLITFSEGAFVNKIENSSDQIFEELKNANQEKICLLDYLRKAPAEKKSVSKQLQKERDLLQKQIYFLENVENFSRFTIMAKFVAFFLKKTSISTGVARLILDEFVSKFMYRQDDMHTWVIENKAELLSIYKMIEGVVIRTQKYIKDQKNFPNQNSSNQELFDGNFFAVIRDKAFNQDKRIKENLSKEDLKFILLSFYYSFQSVDYFKVSKLLGQLKNYIEEDEDAKNIYYEGIQRQIEFYKVGWNRFKDEDLDKKKFYRYQLASYNYEAGNIDWVIEFLKDAEQLQLPEKVLLADSYMDANQYVEAIKYFRDAIKDNQSARVLINTLHCLIMSGKTAEAYLFDLIYSKYINNYSAYKNNRKLLDEEITKLTEKNDYKLSSKILEEIEESEIFSITNTDIPDDQCDEIMNLFAKENYIEVYKHRERAYSFNDKDVNTSFFIQKLYL